MLWAGPENSTVISAYGWVREIEQRGDEIHSADKDRRKSNYNWILKHRRGNRIVIRDTEVNCAVGRSVSIYGTLYARFIRFL